jgi:very-short-patch-repair endonuclease
MRYPEINVPTPGPSPLAGRGAVKRKRKPMNEMTRRARLLRNQPTPAEDSLWDLIRDGRFAGLKFRRQHVVKKYILDFYCPALKLAIEVDGLIHEENKEPDKIREQALNNAGIQVLRLRNEDVLSNPVAVLEKISQIVAHISSTTPPPFTGGRLRLAQPAGRGT